MSHNYYTTPPPNDSYGSSPHFEDPLAAPRPHKLIPDLTANMAQSLDHQLSTNRSRSPYNPMPGFAGQNSDRGISPLPPPQGSDWSPWNMTTPPQSQPYRPNDLSSAFNNMSVTSNTPPIDLTRPSNPSLTAPLPTLQTLTAAIPSIQNPSFDPARKLVWCRDTFFLGDRVNQITSNSPENPPGPGPIHIEDPQLLRLIQIAIPTILYISSPQQMPNPMPGHVAEAIYLRATLASSGAYPEHIPQNPRTAFRDFEQAAKGGHAPAWFRLGRDYEGFGDEKHARTCFERGVKYGVESCLYRMGMAHLLGQLGLPARPDIALPLLQRAATLATVQVAQPAYVYGLLLLNEFSHVTIPPHFLSVVIPPGVTPIVEARKHLERAAYLNFSPAQYKLGHAYEFAEPPFPFDALLSVQYYSLASQQGEVEADMALSKWFLCGAEGAFEKDEALAFTFAEKAARKGLPSAEFALGYYAEVGVGGPKDIETARKWYNRAMQHGNTDASDRLAALSQPAPQSLSRQEHNNLTETTLVRKRTQAKQRSEATPGHMPATSLGHGQKILEDVRNTTMGLPPNPRPVRNAPIDPQLSNGPGPVNKLPVVNEGPITQTPPPMRSSPSPARPSNGHPQGQRPMSIGNVPLSQRARYSLTDPGSRPSPQPSAVNRPSSVAGPNARPSGRLQTNSPSPPPPQSEIPQQAPTRPPPGKKAQTFQDMGFQSQKLEDKECIIM